MPFGKCRICMQWFRVQIYSLLSQNVSVTTYFTMKKKMSAIIVKYVNTEALVCLEKIFQFRTLPSDLQLLNILAKRSILNTLQSSENHCVKSVRIQRFSGLYFPACGLNTERYSISLRIQAKCRKIRTLFAQCTPLW